MSGPEVSTKDSSMNCITDCSILNTTSCQPVTRRQLVTSADQVSSVLESLIVFQDKVPPQLPKYAGWLREVL